MSWINQQNVASNIAALTPQQASDLGLSVWDLFITEAGNDFGGTQPENIQFPPATGPFRSIKIPACSAIAIGPYSTIDAGAVQTPFFREIPGGGGINFATLGLSVHKPILHPINGPLFVSPGGGSVTGFTLASIPFFAPRASWVRSLLPIGAAPGGEVGFGPFPDMAFVNGQSVWVQPLLHVQFYFNGASPQFAPARHPMNDFVLSAFEGAAAETIVRVWPTAGRRRARVIYRHLGGAGTLTVRTMAINPRSAISVNAMIETQLAPTTGAAQAVGVSGFTEHVISELAADFMAARVAAIGGAATVGISFEAWDD